MSEDVLDPEGPEMRIRRILVALDASPASLEALESAAELAARWKAELLGLFVEDVDLLRLAAAASATRFVYPTASEQPLSVFDMESELRALAERARSELGRAAAHLGVRWSFRTVRGRMVTETLLAAAEADLLSLSCGWARTGELWPSPSPRHALEAARRRHSAGLPVLAVYDGSKTGEDAVRFAARLAQMYGSSLIVLLLATSDQRDPQMVADVAGLLGAEHLPVRFRAIDSRDRAEFLRVVRSEQGGVLIIGGSSPLLEEGTLGQLVRESGKTLLIVGARLGKGEISPA